MRARLDAPPRAAPWRSPKTTPCTTPPTAWRATSADNDIAVAAHRTAHTVAVFNASTLPAMTPTVEPWALLAVADGDTAWAVVLSTTATPPT